MQDSIEIEPVICDKYIGLYRLMETTSTFYVPFTNLELNSL
jgi:hypothetical protein